LVDGQVVSLDAIAATREKHNSPRITATGPRRATAVLTIADAPPPSAPAQAHHLHNSITSGLNLEFHGQ
jgi:hypothetical protein